MGQKPPPGRRRGVGLSDLILFVAATAAALAVDRAFVTWYEPNFADPGLVIADMRRRGLSAPFHITYWVQLASPFLLGWTLALIPARLRRPRPSLARLSRQPGAVACLAAAAAVVASLATWALLLLPGSLGYVIVSRSLEGRLFPNEYWAYVYGLTAIGHAVFAAWAVLLLSGRWRAEPSWIDRAGRAFGLAWIALLPLNHWSAFLLS